MKKPSGELKPAARRLARRTSPVADVDIFSYRAGSSDALLSNFLENKERLSKYVLANYGDLGKIIKEQEYPVIQRTVLDPNNELYEGIPAARLRKMHAVLDVEWTKDMKKLEDQRTKLYGFLLQLLTKEGEEKIRSSAPE